MKRIFAVFMFFVLLAGCVTTETKNTGSAEKKHPHKFTKHYEKSLFVISQNGQYSVEMVIKEDSLKVGKNKISIIVHDKKDNDVPGARLFIQPWMPEMGHGIDIEPVIEEKGGGLYEISNLVLTMPGHWEIRVQISKDGITDTAVFDFPQIGKPMMGHHHMKRPEKIDTSTEKRSEKGFYMVSYVPEINPIRINTLHYWTVQIFDQKGRPVSGARIKVEGDMPEHGHGMPTEPQVVQELPDGKYIIDGMKFQMPGWWVVKLHIDGPDGKDTVVFQLDLKR